MERQETDTIQFSFFMSPHFRSFSKEKGNEWAHEKERKRVLIHLLISPHLKEEKEIIMRGILEMKS
jgi:hypothetical protein